MVRQLIVLLTLAVLVTSTTDYLTFVRNATLTPKPTDEHHGDKYTYYYDGTLSSNVVLSIKKVMNNELPNVDLSCNVVRLNEDAQILEAALKYLQEGSDEEEKIILTPTNNKKVIFPRSKISVYVEGDSQIGYRMKTDLNILQRPLSGKFWCELSNKKGSLVTNKVEIQDVDFYMSDFPGRATDKQLDDIKVSDYPIRLRCTDDENKKPLPDYVQSIQPNVNWHICDVSESKNCYSQKKPLNPYEYFSAHLDADGSLILMNLRKYGLKDFGFFCSKYGNNILNVYTKSKEKGINFDNSMDGQEFPLEIVADKIQTIRIREGTYTNPVKIFANYHYSKELVWRRLKGTFELFPSRSKYFMQFPTKVSKEHSGKYCVAFKDDPSNCQITFNVEIVSPPKTKKSPLSLIYVTEDQSVEISAEFENADKYYYLLNGNEFPKNKYKELKSMNIDFIPGPTTTYKATNLKKDSVYGKSHLVTLVAESKDKVFTNTLIRVLPLPDINGALKNGKCSDDCLYSEPHTLSCDFDYEAYSEVTAELTWYFNSHNISDSLPKGEIGKYMSVDRYNLTIQPIGNDTTLRHLLTQSDLYCRLRLLYNTSDNQVKTIFDSDAFKNNLHARFYKDQILEHTINNEMTWIASVVTAIAIILIIALLIVWYCMRNRGETYMVNAYEKAIGNDPEKEFRDVSAFQIYERPDTIPLGGCNNNFDNNDLEITGQDDFLECDYSDEIMTKFNETGSFINGLYGDRTIPKKNVDELVDSRNKRV